MPTTSNFGWTTPADTDLVKDGAAAIRTLGNGIDTSFLDLKGGTTGQNLRKASNTDLDFTFAGDATNTVVDAAGDLLYGTAADTLGRLAIGTAGQILKVNSGATAPEWAAATASSPASASAKVATSQTTTSGSYTDLSTAGPSVTITTGTKALVIVKTRVKTSEEGYVAAATYAVSGATTIAEDDDVRVATITNDNLDIASASRLSTLTAGSNTFTMKYKVTGGRTGTFAAREIIVIDLGS